MRYEVEKTEVFDKWLKKLRDRKAVLTIAKRIGRAIAGNFGDVAPVGEGVSEMRIRLSTLLHNPSTHHNLYALWRKQVDTGKRHQKSQDDGESRIGGYHESYNKPLQPF